MQIGGHELFLIMMGCCGIVVVIMIPLWLLLSIFTPKQLLNRYFKEPHFTQGELIMMAGFPFFLMRTAMFGWGLLFPKLDRKRNIKNIAKYTPLWYKIGLTILTIGIMGAGIAVVSIMFYLLIVDPPA